MAAIKTCSCECGAAAAAINVPVILEIPIGEDVKAMLNLLFGRSVGKETLVSGFCDNIGGICVGGYSSRRWKLPHAIESLKGREVSAFSCYISLRSAILLLSACS